MRPALLHRVGDDFDVALLVTPSRVLGFACTNTNSRERATACATLVENTKNELCALLLS